MVAKSEGYARGMKARATIRDVAARAGVSSATVSYVLNGKGGVGPETAQRVRVAAAELGFRPNATARSLATRRTGLVGVVVGDNCGHAGLTLMFFGPVVESISRSLPGHGYEALLVGPAELEMVDRVDGAILVGTGDEDPVLRELERARVPCVGVDLEVSGRRCGYVGSDNTAGVQLLLAHLYGRGHMRIATISGALQTTPGAERLAAFRDATAALGLELPETYVRIGDFSSASGYREARELMALSPRPTAIVVASDLMALAVLQAVRDSGAEPGRDVAVVGFDDLEAAGLAHPQLTTVRQDRFGLGVAVAECVAAMIDEPDAPPPRRVLPVELVVRASSGERVAA
jgi:LacI family transcriptional regulator